MIFFKNHILFLSMFLITLSGYTQDNSWRTYQKNKDAKKTSLKHKNDSTKEHKNDTTFFSQNDTVKRELNYDGNIGTINITQSSKIDSLTNKIGRRPFINGYTIQIEVSQQKEIIKKARYMFLKYNPDIPLDEKYEQPNTYLFAGRFYDKNSAYEFKHEIRSNFPNAIVIQKKLNLPPLK